MLFLIADAQTFKKGEILRRQTRIDVLGQEVYDGYKSFKSSHIDPRYNLRITIPFKYAQYFPHASDETSPDVLLGKSTLSYYGGFEVKTLIQSSINVG